MTALLLDTNIASYLMKGHPLSEAYAPMIRGPILLVSFMTVAELLEGALRAGWGTHRLEYLAAVLAQYRVVHTTDPMCRYYAQIRAARREKPLSPQDALIAATALAEGIPLVTHNPCDFANIPGLRVLTALHQ